MLFRVTFTAVVFFCVVAALVQLRHGEEPPPAKAFAGGLGAAAPDAGDAPGFEGVRFPRGEQTLRGRVFGADELPASGVLVQLRADVEPRWDFTDDAGSFRIDELPAGELEVVLVRPGHLPVLATVTLPSGGPVLLHLSPPRPPLPALPEVAEDELSGRLIPALREDLAGYEVLLRPTAADDPFAGATQRRVAVGEGGAFRVERLAHGEYALEVLPPWARGGSWPVLAARTVEHPSPLSLDAVRLRAGAFAGTLRDRAGAPLHGALIRVTAADEATRVWPPAITDEAGRYRVADLPPGRYVVHVRAGDRSAEKRLDLDAWQVVDPGFSLAPDGR